MPIDSKAAPEERACGWNYILIVNEHQMKWITEYQTKGEEPNSDQHRMPQRLLL